MSPRMLIAPFVVAAVALAGLSSAPASAATSDTDCRTTTDQSILAGDGDCWSITDIDQLVASGDWWLYSIDHDRRPTQGYVYAYGEEYKTDALYYSPLTSADGSDVISYVISDGEQLVRRSFTVSIEAVKQVMPRVKRKLTAERKAVIKFPNRNTRTIEVLAGSFRMPTPDIDKMAQPGSAVTMKTKRKSVDFIVYVMNDDDMAVYLETGKINTRTGKVKVYEEYGMEGPSSDGTAMRPTARSQQNWNQR